MKNLLVGYLFSNNFKFKSKSGVSSECFLKISGGEGDENGCKIRISYMLKIKTVKFYQLQQRVIKTYSNSLEVNKKYTVQLVSLKL